MANRFDFEQQIMDCWNVVEDVKTVFETVMNTDADTDTVANALLGISTLYNLKFDKLFGMFEQEIKKGYETETELRLTKNRLWVAEQKLEDALEKSKPKKVKKAKKAVGCTDANYRDDGKPF